MAKFFPALAHTDCMAYIDQDGSRKIMSVRRLLPKSMQKRALMSLSFDESIHYNTSESDGDSQVDSLEDVELSDFEEIFVDCGAFHYSKMKTPKFLNGGFVRSSSTLEQCEKRHFSRGKDAHYLICSPDHIIHSGLSEEQVINRREFTRISAKSFLKITEDLENVTPIAVVHGRTLEERIIETKYMIDLGYKYIAFGGLVPIARDLKEVLHQIAGISPLDAEKIEINKESPLGLLKSHGIKSHMFGLNSPEWYRWWKRLGVDSFDGSKLSQEGAANGIIWLENTGIDEPLNAKQLYRRLQIKKIKERDWNITNSFGKLIVSKEGEIDFKNAAWNYLQQARCTSPKCPHGDVPHNCDPRVTGSIEHNMGRMLLNAYTFEQIILKIDKLYELANESKELNQKHWLSNWTKIEVSE